MSILALLIAVVTLPVRLILSLFGVHTIFYNNGFYIQP